MQRVAAEHHRMKSVGLPKSVAVALKMFQSRSRSSEAKRTLSQNSRDATLMSQTWRLSRPHLRRLHPVHKYHKEGRQQSEPLWESTAHIESAWCNAKNVNIALALNALTINSSHYPPFHEYFGKHDHKSWLGYKTQIKSANSDGFTIICEA